MLLFPTEALLCKIQFAICSLYFRWECVAVRGTYLQDLALDNTGIYNGSRNLAGYWGAELPWMYWNNLRALPFYFEINKLAPKVGFHQEQPQTVGL